MPGPKYFWQLGWFVKSKDLGIAALRERKKQAPHQATGFEDPCHGKKPVAQRPCHLHRANPTTPASFNGGSPPERPSDARDGGFPAGEQLGSCRGLLMNMQTQIDLFPLGTCYYSQILISLQIPPVPAASFPTSSPGQDPGSQEAGGPPKGHAQKEGYPGPHRVASKGRGQGLGRGSSRAGRGSSWSSGSRQAANLALLSRPGQFPAWHCSSSRGGGNRPCYTPEGKPNMFPTLTKPTTRLRRE